MSILEQFNLAALRHYLSICKSFENIDVQNTARMASYCIKYYSGDKNCRDMLAPAMQLENKWYASLDKGLPDYSVYGDPFYVGDIWACWVVYSRKYLIGLKSSRTFPDNLPVSLIEHIGKIENVIDVGCGPGYTTSALKELFPNARVFGTNFPGTTQFKVATKMGQERGFNVIDSVHSLRINNSLIFASEYFEHIENPVEHLLEIISHTKPKALIIANAFGARSVGHFYNYKHLGEIIPNDKIGRVFNNALRTCGYRQVKTKLWNNRPAYWRLASEH